MLCDPTDLIWRKGTPFKAMTGCTVASDLWLGIRTGAGGIATLTESFFGHSPWLHGQQVYIWLYYMRYCLCFPSSILPITAHTSCKRLSCFISRIPSCLLFLNLLSGGTQINICLSYLSVQMVIAFELLSLIVFYYLY